MPSTRIITYNIPNYPYDNTLPNSPGPLWISDGRRSTATRANFYNRPQCIREKWLFPKSTSARNWSRKMVLATRAVGGVDDRRFVLEFLTRRLQEMPELRFATSFRHADDPYSLHTHSNDRARSVREAAIDGARFSQQYAIPRQSASRLRRVAEISDRRDLLRPFRRSGHGSEFKPHWDGQQEFVPCFIYNTDEDLGAQQRTRGQAVATDGTLTLLDITTYLRGQVAAANGVSLATTTPELNPISSPSMRRPNSANPRQQ